MNNKINYNNTHVRDNHFTHGLWVDQDNQTHRVIPHRTINISHRRKENQE